MRYETDPAAIYRESFATIRAEVDLGGLRRRDPVAERVVVRMIHACGMVDLVDDVEMSDDFATAGRAALRRGAPVLVDSRMVAYGITRSRLPADNAVVCTLDGEGVRERARAVGTTRSAAAVDAWVPHLGGALVAIGNAPTALFRLLELLEAGGPRPAVIVGVPVGFVGAAESKRALATAGLGVPYLTVHGRRGGSALAVAVVNALGSDAE